LGLGGEKVLKSYLVVLFAVAIVACTMVPAVQAENWQQVKTASGTDEQSIFFSIQSTHWRVHWQYEPELNYQGSTGEYAYLGVNLFLQQGGILDDWEHQGGYITAGDYEYYQAGDFQLRTYPANLASYHIIIEQDVDAIPSPSPTVPEFPETIVVLALASVVSAGFVLMRKRLKA
jgi:hypothetical protein